MKKDIYDYFLKQYRKLNIKVVAGHYPDFKSIQEVDDWIKELNNISEYIDYLQLLKNKENNSN